MGKSHDLATIAADGLEVDTIKNTGGTTGLTINSAGITVMPNRPAFACHLESTVALATANGWSGTNGSNSLSSGTWDWNITHGGYNVGGHWSDSTNRFTAPVAGLYSFTFSMVMAAAGANCSFRLQHSTGVSRYAGTNFDSASNNVTASSVTAQFLMAVNEYVDLQVGYARSNSVEGDSSGFGRTWWSGYLIG